ncbi:MAG TPA: alpha/beta fold hydrolase [Acetobacteraceae bacterium]
MIHHYAGGTVAAAVTGEGLPVWVFHSLLADAGSCTPLAAALSGSYRVTVPDLPGFGGSAPVDAGLEAVADRLAAAIEEAGGPVAVIGNGYGSFVALTLALRHPALVSRLVLAGTGAAFDEPGRAAFRGMAGAAGSKGLAAIADTAMRRLFSPAFQQANPALLAERRERFLATDPAMFAAACNALASLDISDAVRGLHVPVLVTAGELDEATPPAMARQLAALLPDASFIELPGLAHVPQLQDTPAFVAAVRGALPGRPA